MKKMLKNKKGFTLIELMIVVAIIGILAAIAIPNFMNYQCKAKQSEAKANLGNIKTMMEAYRAEYDYYPGTLSVVGFEINATDARYVYTVTGGTNTFTAKANAADLNGAVDTWLLSNNGALNNTANACQ
jgi:type IV pilus assembly protein PilA